MLINKPYKCTRCGFIFVVTIRTSRGFDGWDADDLKMKPSECPFCRHLKKFGCLVTEGAIKSLKKAKQ